MKLFQITEDDLAELEKTLPRVFWDHIANMHPRQRVRWQKVQTILSNVRWGYGPPTQVEIIPAGDGQ